MIGKGVKAMAKTTRPKWYKVPHVLELSKRPTEQDWDKYLGLMIHYTSDWLYQIKCQLAYKDAQIAALRRKVAKLSKPTRKR